MSFLYVVVFSLQMKSGTGYQFCEVYSYPPH